MAAECLEFEKETWSELDFMQSSSLFSLEEVKAVLQERSSILCRCRNNRDAKEPYLEFITYEENLLKKLAQRREQRSITQLRIEIDHKIQERLKAFYKQFVLNYRHDLELWRAFLKFCQENKFTGTGAGMVKEMVETHGAIDRVFIYAANWEMSGHSRNAAAEWLKRGIMRHPESVDIYYEAIKLELDSLLLADKKASVKVDFKAAEVKPNKLYSENASNLLDQACKQIKDFAFYKRIFNVFTSSTYERVARCLRLQVIEYLMKTYPTNEQAWSMKAESVYLSCMEGSTQALPHIARERESNQRVSALATAVEVYVEGVQKLHTVTMWDLFLEFLVEHNKKGELQHATHYQSALLLQYVHTAHKNEMVSERFIIMAIEKPYIFSLKPSQVLEFLTKGLISYPQSPQLWYESVRFHLTRNDLDKALTQFDKANKNLMETNASKVFPMWQMLLQYLNCEGPDIMEVVFYTGLRLRDDLAQFLKPMYLTWKVISFGMGDARKLLEMPEITARPCKEFYKKLISYEMMQTDLLTKNIRHCHEILVNNFGRNDYSLWVAYIQYECRLREFNAVKELRERAKRNLVAEQYDTFLKSISCSEKDIVVLD